MSTANTNAGSGSKPDTDAPGGQALTAVEHGTLRRPPADPFRMTIGGWCEPITPRRDGDVNLVAGQGYAAGMQDAAHHAGRTAARRAVLRALAEDPYAPDLLDAIKVSTRACAQDSGPCGRPHGAEMSFLPPIAGRARSGEVSIAHTAGEAIAVAVVYSWMTPGGDA